MAEWLHRMKDIHPLYTSVIIFIFSLMGAFVTFGILESSGVVQDERIQLGGSVAGFIAIFFAFSRFYNSQMEKVRDEKLRKLAEELKKEKEMGKKSLHIVLKFNQDDLNIGEVVHNLKFEKCTLKIYDDKFEEKESSNIILALGGEQAWTFKLPNLNPDSIASLEIVDNKKRKWEVNPFRLYAPYSITKQVLKR